MCGFLYANVSLVIGNVPDHHPAVYLLSIPMLLMSLWVNFVGIQACWHCEKFGFDWTKEWNEQKY